MLVYLKSKIDMIYSIIKVSWKTKIKILAAIMFLMELLNILDKFLVFNTWWSMFLPSPPNLKIGVFGVIHTIFQ